MQVHLSKSQIGLLVAGVIISGLTAFSAASKSGLMTLDSRGLLAEVGGSGYQKAGQVTFWKDGSTITGDPNFTWDSIRSWLKANVLQSSTILAPAEFALRPGYGRSTNKLVEIYGRVRAYGTSEGPNTIEIRGGGLRFYNPNATMPSCTENSRGLIWFRPTSVTTGKDSMTICVKDSSLFLWREIPILVEEGAGGGGGGGGGNF